MSDQLHRHGKRTSDSMSYRLAVVSRVMAALCGGYFVAYASTALLTVILPFDRINRVVTASLLSFVVWCGAAIWVFGARRALQGWWTQLLVGALMLGLAFLFRSAGMRP